MINDWPLYTEAILKSPSAASSFLFSASFFLCITISCKFALLGDCFYFIGSASFIHFHLKIFPSEASLLFICNFQCISIHFLLHETLPKMCLLKLLSSLKGFFQKRQPFCFSANEILEENFVKSPRFAHQATHCVTDCPCSMLFASNRYL